MAHLYQVTHFRAKQLQKLRNVTMHSATITQVLTGSKKLFWMEDSYQVSNTRLLLSPASASLSFENLPEKGYFSSRLFSFHCQPSASMLELSERNRLVGENPTLKTNKSTEDMLNSLYALWLSRDGLSRDALSRDSEPVISEETQQHFVMGLFQHLAEQGALHLMFPRSDLSFSQKLKYLVAKDPSKENRLEEVAKSLAISRATLIRRLKQEGTQYREVLADVRFNHALNLMQNGQYNVIQLAQMCGYQSESRFSQRFKTKFGVTPKEYIRSIGKGFS